MKLLKEIKEERKSERESHNMKNVHVTITYCSCKCKSKRRYIFHLNNDEFFQVINEYIFILSAVSSPANENGLKWTEVFFYPNAYFK